MIPRLLKLCIPLVVVGWFVVNYVVTWVPEGSTPSIRIFAAASLTEPFEELVRSFSPDEDATKAALHLAGTSTLAFQILEGAGADVFASADHAQMQRVVDAGLTTASPRVFARNKLVIAVPDGNPEKIDSLTDLVQPRLKVALCAPTVPAGRYARLVLDRANVRVQSVSDEPNVRALLRKLTLGVIDAAIVYATDTAAAGGFVSSVRIPDEDNVVAEYWIAPVSRGRLPKSESNTRAQAFIDHVLSPGGQGILGSFGFEPR